MGDIQSNVGNEWVTSNHRWAMNGDVRNEREVRCGREMSGDLGNELVKFRQKML